MDHPLGAQLMVFAVAGLLEIETVGLGLRAVLALAVGVTEVPPAPRHAVIEQRVVGGVQVIAHRIMTAAQHQLIGQAQRAVPVKRRAPLLLAGAALAVVTARQPDTPRLLRGVLDQHLAATDVLARRQLHLRLIRRQAVELIHHLLDFPQIDQLPAPAGKSHPQFALRQLAALRALQPFEPALDHQHLQMPAGQILLRQVGTAGDQAFFDVVIGDDFQQLVELRDAQALTDVRLEQAIFLAVRKTVGAFEFDVLDGETTGVGRGRRGRGLGCLAG
ncbi:hypothetical protein SRABI130_05987 [Pseudomonas sp. Bi130]|nr:hypothetical protein SRABI130_05987 [Pseudomonas sp. Bi130]